MGVMSAESDGKCPILKSDSEKVKPYRTIGGLNAHIAAEVRFGIPPTFPRGESGGGTRDGAGGAGGGSGGRVHG